MKLQNNLNQYSRFFQLIQWSMECIDKHIPIEDVYMLDRVVVLDKNISENYPDAGGIYYHELEGEPAFVELYMEEIISGIPRFLPRIDCFIKYSILKMLLHEVGHHVNKECVHLEDREQWEYEASKYEMKYLWKIYGYKMYIFLTLGTISKIKGSGLHS